MILNVRLIYDLNLIMSVVAESVKTRFEKKSSVGKGSYGTVFEALDRATGCSVALKKYLADGSDDGIPQTTLKEMIIMKLCDHPNIVKMVWYDNLKFRYLSMPLYQSDLKGMINNFTGSLENNIIRDISYQVLMGIWYMHSIGMVHRDIKPQNILVEQVEDRYVAVLADIGSGRKMDPVDPKCPKTGVTCTLWYRAPEVLLGEQNYYYTVDVWSAGCVIAEMMRKRALFPGCSEIDQIYKIFKLLGTPTDDTWPGVSKLPDYKSMFPQWSETWNETFKDCDPTLTDLTRNILQMDPKKRYTCYQSLNHPAFSSIPDYITKVYDELPTEDCCTKHLDNLTKWDMMEVDESMNDQTEIKSYMRCILLDWLFEVKLEYRLLTTTYIRGQVILDRYLTMVKTVTKSNLQLVGIGCLWIAAKMEEVYPPAADQFAYISDNTYSSYQVMEMEKEILRVLDLDVYFPVTTNFLMSYVNKIGLSKVQKREAEFLLSYVVYNTDLQRFHPSVLTLCVCLHVTGQDDMIYREEESDVQRMNISNGSVIHGDDIEDDDIEDVDDISECMEMMKKWLKRGREENLIRLMILFNHYQKSPNVTSKYL